MLWLGVTDEIPIQISTVATRGQSETFSENLAVKSKNPREDRSARWPQRFDYGRSRES
ncbi:hypothetical protein ZHAS_00013638 [Anopheles sinensis]|uniref:Uncharacterized protein n=1 Tax=Anopheles sinensis TaxID=74873 RepID=A0A084W600_ANOSI|nr:hypothetical protein ZHAS_00013638 [Anopheles sinensis]